MAKQLLIGDVTVLTGIAPGRIRHYEKLGMLRSEHLSNGYRVFDVDQVLQLLRIDLLRSLGVGIKDIGRLLESGTTTLVDVLNTHRTVLAQERNRLDRLLEAIDSATDSTLMGSSPDDADTDNDERILWRLATSHRDSIGLFGRLSTPLSPEAATIITDSFGGWDLPVPPLFGQMVLPSAASTMLEDIAMTPGRTALFDRLRHLAGRVVAFGDDGGAAISLAHSWIDEQVDHPLPADVLTVLRSVQPMLERDPVIVSGFDTWAASIAPAASAFLSEVAKESARRGLDTISVIVLPAGT
ncbi:MAG: MerR family transcriptional regulator [Mycobacterium sp.]